MGGFIGYRLWDLAAILFCLRCTPVGDLSPLPSEVFKIGHRLWEGTLVTGYGTPGAPSTAGMLSAALSEVTVYGIAGWLLFMGAFLKGH